MNKRRVFSFLVAVFVAAACSQAPEGQHREASPLLRTVPSDALVVMDFDHCCDVLSFLPDSTSAISKLTLGQLKNNHCVLSYVYTGQLEPVLAIDAGKAPADTTESITTLLCQAEDLGLHACFFAQGWAEGEHAAIFVTHASASMPAVIRHIEGFSSIYDATSFKDALQHSVGGKGTIYVRNSGLDKSIPKSFLKEFVSRSQLINFLKKAADWTIISVSPSKALEISTVLGPSMEHYTNLFSALPMGESKVGTELPADTDFAVAQPIPQGFREQFRSYMDACVKLVKYEKKVAELKSVVGKSPEVWEKEQGIEEVAYVFWNGYKLALARPRKTTEDTTACENPYQGFLPVLFGDLFGVNDTHFAAKDGWMIFGEEPAVQAFIACEEHLAEEDWQYKSCHFVVYRPDRRLSWDPKGIRYGVQTTE